MNRKQLIKETFEKGQGVFRLMPNFVPRRFGKPGKRMKLHPDDLFALGIERGSMKERWFTSVIPAINGPLAPKDEGMSYVSVSYDNDEKFTLKEAIDILGTEMIGDELYNEYGTWPMYSKYFDFENPLFHHVHLTFEDAAKVGKLGKPECYFFPKQLNNYDGEFPSTYFGFSPDVTKEEVKERIAKYKQGDTRITELSRAHRIELGTGWYTPAGVIHAPGSYLTYEPQWNSDVNSVQENIVSGEIYPFEMLVENCPEDKKNDLDYIVSLLDWDKNVDPDYRKHYFRPPVIDIENDDYKDTWIAYDNDGYFSAKELVIKPGKSIVLVDPAAYGCIFIQGHGKFSVYDCESPTLLRFGKQSSDEFFVSKKIANEGITITNKSKVEDLVMLRHFAPDNKDYPKVAK